MDIALAFINGQFDIQAGPTDLVSDNSLGNAVIVSLFTNRRAANDDIVEGNDRGGSWQDSYPDVAGDLQGSRLWLLRREVATGNVLERAKEYCLEALQWLIDDGLAKSIKADAEFQGNMLALRIIIQEPSGSVFDNWYQYPLEVA